MTINLLTREEADKLVNEAWNIVANHTLGSYRFGRTLHHLLPLELVKHFNRPDHNFYCWQDSDKVLEVFYKYYVENRDVKKY